MTDHFVTIAGMIDDLRADDSEKRLISMKALVIIAQTLGAERTRSELLPYITEYLDEDDDVLRAMAAVLGHMLEEVGGAQHVAALLAPLELLCGLDEVTVRDTAVASLNEIAAKIFPGAAAGGSAPLSTVEAQREFLATLMRLGESEHVHCRSSASGIVAIPYRHGSGPQRRDLRVLFNKLCDDPEVCVRRSACVALGASMAPAMETGVSEFFPSLKKFAQDAHDSVRVQAVPATVALLPYLPDANVTQVIQSMRALTSDSVWRVRYMVADRLGALCQNVRKAADPMRTLISMHAFLCEDNEPDIRASCVFSTDAVLSGCPTEEARRECLTSATKLGSDSNSHVRCSLASTLLKCAPVCGTDLFNRSILPTATTLLADSEHSVRLAMLSSFSFITDSVDVHRIAPSLLPVVVALFKDTNWRARENVVRQIPAIVRSVGWSDDLLGVSVAALSDRVASIRACAAAACHRLVEKEGSAWARTVLLPKVLTLATSRTFSQRVALLHALHQMVDVLDAAVCKEMIWPIIQQLAADPVPNVRVNAAKWVVFATNARKLSSADAEPIVAKLAGDSDADVRDTVSQTAIRRG